MSIEWSGSCEVMGEHKVRVHIECKNYGKVVSHNEVGGKLLMEGLVHPPVIDHWILISPHADPSNELNRFLETHQKSPQYAFDVQVWSPESGVRDWFALEPDVYGELYGFEDGEADPRTWSTERREEVRRRWMARLRPPLRLPVGWSDYARDPDKLCSPPETPAIFRSAFEHAVPMRCLNAAGVLLDRPLRHYVDEWLQQADGQTLFILGEFGDGKTFFTYALARELMEGWVSGGDRGWLVLRLPLKKYPGNAREFLRQRLEEFGADVAGWLALGKQTRRLVVLDGFDEMSVSVGPSAVTQNIGSLLGCVKEFEGCKVLITSRTHFFESRVDAQRLMTRLGNPTVYQLAPLERREAWRNIEQHLLGAVGLEEARSRLARIERLNDPIGLAQKPLFLQMVKVVLSSESLPDNLSVCELYESYIDESLRRNDDRLDDGEFRADPAETLVNLRWILGELAEELQRSGRGWVSLSRFQTLEQKPFAELLWRLSEGSEELEKDARTRVGARSLLGRVAGESGAEGWLVDFCHRSMREYFVAIRLCEKVEAGLGPGLEFLKSVPLNHEILHFATQRWREVGGSSFVSTHLQKIIEQAVPANQPGLSGGYALTLLYRLNPILPRDFDWRGKVLDGVDLEEADLGGLDFSGASLVSANLINANLESTCFEDCDLTGVHLEETKSVVSLAATPSGDEIVALYGDSTLREWHLTLTGRATSRVVLSEPPEPGSVVGVQDAGRAWLRRGQRWSFLERGKGQWIVGGTFPIRRGYEHIDVCGSVLAYTIYSVNESENGKRLAMVELIDLAGHAIAASVRLIGLQRCALLGTHGLVWSDVHQQLHFQDLDTLASKAQAGSSTGHATLELPGTLTALATRQCKAGNYLVAAGMDDGTVLVWRVTLTAGQWQLQQILAKSAHQGMVTTVALMNDSELASGGFDRAIVVVRLLGPEHLEGADERKLMRTLRCRNMRIRGVRGPREDEMLRGYIARCEESS